MEITEQKRKRGDDEELVDYYIHRPLAHGLVRLFWDTRVHPNHLTIASGLLGVAAGVLIALAQPQIALVAIAGFVHCLCVLFDCADGQLARARGEVSLAGRALDGIIDAVPVFAIFIGTAYFLISSGYDPFFVLPFGFAAGLSLRWHAERHDLAKCLFVANTSDSYEVEPMPTLEEIDQECAQLRANGQRWLSYFLYLFRHYTIAQRRYKSDITGLDRRRMRDARERGIYRELFVRYIRWYSWLGFGTHHFVMWIAALITPFVGPEALLGAWFLILVPGNIVGLLLVWWGRRLEVELTGRVGRAPAGQELPA